MNNVLNNILMQCGLIVPLEETETDVLAKACSEYISNESFSFEDFELIDIPVKPLELAGIEANLILSPVFNALFNSILK